ncbi:GlcG/HbpS family heme-binding protein [Actinomadura montaniterrae]|uniref:Heme-binding protein n=1 Tax=Actinomadura montaniterrae TaxID=1803903 RepID=A0A6L3VLP9_9ACTN|nr:heme-binding protein [Actinomadura montaniterrae]KAB2368163.1 heme-binding protein [Actinomadura montaniterrae]
MSIRRFIGGAVALGAAAAGAVGVAGPASAAAPAATVAVQDGHGKPGHGHGNGHAHGNGHGKGHGHGRHDSATAPERVLSNSALVRASREFVESARRHGNQRVTMVIMERAGTIRLVVRTRKAGPQTYVSAKAKAYTAVAFGQPTSALSGNETIKQIPGTLTLPGGVPVFYKGFPIAGIGVGGAPDGRIDEAIANDVLAAVNR